MRVRLGLAAGLLAAAALPANAGDVTVEVGESDAVYRVHGTFHAAAPVTAAWGVLADYEHIDRFVRSMRSSVFVTRPDGRRLLRQDAYAGVFPFRRAMHVELALEEEPGRRIGFRDVAARDFERYEGAWTLRPDSAGTTITYALDAEPRAGMPGVLGRAVMSRSARDLLTQVRAEILRRASAAERMPAPGTGGR